MAVLRRARARGRRTALEDSALLGLAAADVDEILDRRPEIGREVIRVLVRRLRAANLR